MIFHLVFFLQNIYFKMVKSILITFELRSLGNFLKLSRKKKKINAF